MKIFETTLRIRRWNNNNKKKNHMTESYLVKGTFNGKKIKIQGMDRGETIKKKKNGKKGKETLDL